MRRADLYRRLGAVLVAIAGFYIVLSGIEVSRAFRLLLTADITVFGAGTGLLILIYLLIAERWEWILDEKGIDISRRGSFRQVMVSDFVNSFMPGRAGDVYRGYMASGDEKNAVETSVMVAMERFMDFAAVTLLLLVSLASFLPGSGFLIYPAVTAALLLAALLVLKLLQTVDELDLPYVARYYSKARTVILDNFRTSRAAKLFTLTLVIWGVGILRTLTVFEALDMGLPLGLVTVVTFLWAMVSAIPLTPAGFGTTDASIYLLLQGAGVPGTEAVAFILLNRVMLQGVPVVLGGGFYLQRRL